MKCTLCSHAVFVFAALVLPTSAQDVHEDAERGFRIAIPAGWEMREEGEALVKSLSLFPVGEEARTKLTITPVPSASVGGLDGAQTLVRVELAQAGDTYTDVKDVEQEILGRTAQGITLTANLAGQTYLLRQLWVEENGFVYILQTLLADDVAEERKDLVAEAWAGFAFVAPPELSEEERLLQTLTARCGTEVDWAESWEAAAARARASRCLVLVAAQMVVGFTQSDVMGTGPFMDPEVVALVRARYVPLRLSKGMHVPFEDPALYGMGATTFGSSFLLVTPDGEVVGETLLSLFPFLYDGLAAHPDFPGPPAPEMDDPLDLAAALLARGDLRQADELLQHPTTARAHRLRAELHRRRREGPAALTALEAARGAPGATELAADLALDEALLHAWLGKSAEATRRLAAWREDHADHPRASEAGYLAGALAHQNGDVEEATAIWTALTRGSPDDRWAWKAAGTLTGTAFAVGQGERLRWVDERLRNVSLRPVFEAVPTSEVDRTCAEATRWLLARQREDGTWFSTTEGMRYLPDEPDDLALAANVIATQALLGYLDDPPAARAAERGLAALLAEYRRVRAFGAPVFFMDYGSWSRPYLLWVVADALAAGIGERAELEAAAESLVAEVAAKQKRGGGWSYYVTSDVTSENDPSEVSISCNTAAAMLALLRARDVGLEVPASLIERGLDCLEGMRNPNGTFEYMTHPDQGIVGRTTQAPGAAGRGPACTLALLRGGRTNPEALRESLDLFVAHCDELAREVGKALMHAGSDGQGSHYLLYDWATAAMATAELPASDRVKYREAILDVLLRSRGPDGSYLDNPLIGRTTGTGLALIAFRNLGIGSAGER